MTALPLLRSGKVRDVYDAGGGNLLMVTSDRISAFDVVMPEPIPDKGRCLTAMTAFWVDHMSDVAPNHLVSVDPADLPEAASGIGDLEGRAMLVRHADMLPIECIVRGYLSGSAWKEYRAHGTVHGAQVQPGLEESAQLPEPMFTPSTKAESGHDQNVSFDEACRLVGVGVAEAARSISLATYVRASTWAAERGILLADTKFELGFIDGELAICDEVLTPDSSRFWPAAEWRPGAVPPSFDKQPLRDWLEESGWDKAPPAPHLPPHVVESTRWRYVDAYERITGRHFAHWPGVAERSGDP
ncbi:MAG: phosphoribosylaminoimidazolesuccinocarboxamide synthase [Actinomycetota bacterium]|nr:phosphoribosylaminoimidazolesuccinocarboxamide synthase [Actinomycetota bacterium]